jgi:G:T/U-mismatch repair DNA glycosylase
MTAGVDRSRRAPRPRVTGRPAPADLLAAHGSTIPDVIAPGLTVLFCGINPGLWSAAVRLHFARPGNRFWPALHRSGFTPRLMRPDEQDQLPALGLGIPQPEPLGGARVWVLPNPSGLNAHYTPDRLATEFAALRAAAQAGRPQIDPAVSSR